MLGLSKVDERLFPFLYHRGRVPAKHRFPQFDATRSLCKHAGITHIRQRALRNTRVNWLLRRSRDLDLTANMAAHTKETLIRVYEAPHLQSAASEIGHFHATTDPTLAPPGPGLCAGAARKPEALPFTSTEAPEPDCISPDGCLFCVHHRDVMNAEYCWKLASHARLKVLEAALHKPPRDHPAHPAIAVIDRIDAKLNVIADGSEVRAQWVADARDAIREGRHHPHWDSRILLLEALS